MARTPSKAQTLLFLAMIGTALMFQQASACPFAGMGGAAAMRKDMADHARKMMSHGGRGGGGGGGGNGGAGLSLQPAPTCKEYFKTFNKCDSIAGFGSFSPTFYEKKGCVGGVGLWQTVVNALDNFDHPHYGKSFVPQCLAPLIRNVFHMDVALGHNARLFLEDYGSKKHPSATPDKNPKTSRSAKLAGPNLTLRCYDVYEHLRVEVDKYTDAHCKDVYVSCTDLANYAARYAHWKLSGERFLPCYNFGFADAEPEDFAADPFHKNLTPKAAAESCLPPHDSADVFPDLPPQQSLTKDKFNPFFTKAMQAFSKPCYHTPKPMQNKDLANILMGHTVGEAHCFVIEILVKEPFMNNDFFNKLASDCNKCRSAVAAGTPINPYSDDFRSNINPKLQFSFAQKCKTAGQQEYLPAGKTTGINRVETFLPRFSNNAEPCCVPNDVFTKDVFDFEYFPQVMNGLGLFEVDNGLPIHKETRSLTKRWAKCSQSLNLFKDYQEAWNKMNLIGGKPYDGKRRKFCSVPTWAKV